MLVSKNNGMGNACGGEKGNVKVRIGESGVSVCLNKSKDGTLSNSVLPLVEKEKILLDI